MQIRLLTLLVTSLLLSTDLQAQKLPFKFGKVSNEEMNLKECSFYPEANSMVLAEYGDLRFNYVDNKGWQYIMEVAVRKKIFKTSDADEGNIKIRLYEPLTGSTEEKISSLKAYTHNLVNGKIEREKLDREEYFTKRLNDYWVEISFAIPGIKNGSVIEYSYVKTSDYIYNLSTWYFQTDIPTAHSEFRFILPQYFNYQVSQLGNIYQISQESKYRPETFRYRWESGPQKGGRIERGTGTLESNSEYRRYVATNIPPIEEEPYMTNKGDVPSRLEFQLVSTQFPNSPVEMVAGNYEKFNHELLASNSFGQRLKNGNFINDFAETISSTDQLEIAQNIYYHIVNQLTWDQTHSFMSGDAGRPVYKDQTGGVADINLTLIAALREKNIQAYPIISSTRGNGRVHPFYPSYDDFNYVTVGIVINEKIILCDATSKLPFGQLPLKCRNDRGWLVSENGGQWINMKVAANYDKTTMLTTDISANQIKTTVSQKETDYAAYSTINDIKKSSIEEFEEDLKSSFDDATIQEITISEPKVSEPVMINYEILKENQSSDIIYIQPILVGAISSNPFKREERISIIDFPYSQNFKVISQIKVPEDYTVELPEPMMIKLPDDKGHFLFNISHTANMISVISDLKISGTEFGINEYPTLKAFFQMVVDKNQELIVLSK
ncbi:MAG: DUF3857 domain-containing protein [Fulvivirga sp.]